MLRHPGVASRQRVLRRALTTVVVVISGSQLPPSDRVQILLEAIAPGKDL